MYQYAKEKLTQELIEKDAIKLSINGEIEEIRQKIEDIYSYDKLCFNSVSNKVVILICCILTGVFAFAAVGIFVRIPGMIAKIVGSTIGIGVIFKTIFIKRDIRFIKNQDKEIKRLKALGVKEFQKNEEKLCEKKLELEKELSNIQNNIDKIITNLENIDFAETSENNPFFQADTKEEYEVLMSVQGNFDAYLEEYLNEPINYSSIDLELNHLQANYNKKLTKVYGKEE